MMPMEQQPSTAFLTGKWGGSARKRMSQIRKLQDVQVRPIQDFDAFWEPSAASSASLMETRPVDLRIDFKSLCEFLSPDLKAKAKAKAKEKEEKDQQDLEEENEEQKPKEEEPKEEE